MKPPRLPLDYPDRPLECQEAMESDFITLMDKAIASGWFQKEALTAICGLVENYALAADANESTDRQIADALKARRHRH